MKQHSTRKPTQAEGRRVVVEEVVLTAAQRRWPGLRELVVAGAGYAPKASDHRQRRPRGDPWAVMIYCIRGGGWCEMGGKIHRVRKGHLVVIPTNTPHAYGAQGAHPWTVYWVRFRGGRVADYLGELGFGARTPVLWLGEDVRVMALFAELLRDLGQRPQLANVFHASHTLGHLLSAAIAHRGAEGEASEEGVAKVAQCIEAMSERLGEPLRIAALASQVNLSPGHFAVLFKRQTGCSPCGYLKLLRMHRACQWLWDRTLTVKEIAARLGYRDAFHFSRVFKRHTGLSPSDHRGAGDPVDPCEG